MSETSQFGAFLQRLSLRAADNAVAGSGGTAIAGFRGGSDDWPRAASGQHILTMCARRASRFEGRDWRGRRLSYTKQAGALSLVPAGVCPVLRSRTDFELIVCALDAALVSDIGDELERPPTVDLRLQTNIHDRATRQLLELLLAAVDEDAAVDRLYIDHLTHALAFRFLLLGRTTDVRRATAAPAALPRRALRRVEERMRDLENDLSLQALAQESGYSRVHFARMFKAATGHTPHSYVLRLRVEHARELLAKHSLSLTEIALECGFSSHSHMTRVFNQFCGVTPSAYRRNL